MKDVLPAMRRERSLKGEHGYADIEIAWGQTFEQHIAILLLVGTRGLGELTTGGKSFGVR